MLDCIPSVFKPTPLGGASSPLCTTACRAPPHGSTGMHVCPLAVSQSSQVIAWHAMSQCHHTDFTTLVSAQPHGDAGIPFAYHPYPVLPNGNAGTPVLTPSPTTWQLKRAYLHTCCALTLPPGDAGVFVYLSCPTANTVGQAHLSECLL